MEESKNGLQTLRPQGYIPRIIDEKVEQYLKLFGAVEITGTKWCGKTWTALAHGSSITYIDEDNNLELAKADPSLVLEGLRPHVVDEWQQVPKIWNTVRHEIDQVRNLRGAWLLTGSSTPPVDDSRHSGAGRIGRIRMLPMSLSESADSCGSVSLSALFRGEFQKTVADDDTFQLIELCCRGGWPEVCNESVENAQEIASEYLRAIYETSAPAHDKNPIYTRALVGSIARNLGQSPTYKTIASDMFGSPEEAPSEKTIATYLSFLKSIYLIQEIPGWLPPSRSPKRLRMKPKRYFADPSLAVSALGLSPKGFLSDWQTFGLVFENLCIRDLSVYASVLPNTTTDAVKYYRDETGLEADAIIELADGSWAAFEFKVSEEKVPVGVESLKRVRSKVLAARGSHIKPPVFMAVLTGIGSYAREVEKGIYVIPIRCLGA